jgi:hypothetical protein
MSESPYHDERNQQGNELIIDGVRGDETRWSIRQTRPSDELCALYRGFVKSYRTLACASKRKLNAEAQPERISG